MCKRFYLNSSWLSAFFLAVSAGVGLVTATVLATTGQTATSSARISGLDCENQVSSIDGNLSISEVCVVGVEGGVVSGPSVGIESVELVTPVQVHVSCMRVVLAYLNPVEAGLLGSIRGSETVGFSKPGWHPVAHANLHFLVDVVQDRGIVDSTHSLAVKFPEDAVGPSLDLVVVPLSQVSISRDGLAKPKVVGSISVLELGVVGVGVVRDELLNDLVPLQVSPVRAVPPGEEGLNRARRQRSLHSGREFAVTESLVGEDLGGEERFVSVGRRRGSPANGVDLKNQFSVFYKDV